MCGIAGIVSFDGAPVPREVLKKMVALAHRGPDAEGFLEDAAAAPAVGLVHRRLSIIDLSHVADQPLANEDGTVHALLNGEVYNFQQRRAGWPAATRSVRRATPRSSSTAGLRGGADGQRKGSETIWSDGGKGLASWA